MDDPAYEAEAIARARRKLADLRSGKVVPVPAGRFTGRVAGGVTLILLGVGWPVFLYAISRGATGDQDAVNAVVAIFSAFGLLPAVPGLLMLLTVRATTPKRALMLFYKSVGSGNIRGARSLVVPNDFDDFPRYFPEHTALGRSSNEYDFRTEFDFADYWKRLVRYPTWPYCITRVSSVRVEQLDEDLVVTDFWLKLGINTYLWVLLIPVAWLVAIIIDVATRKRLHEPMRKILVRVGDEWHLFSGEWQGPDERDDSWL